MNKLIIDNRTDLSDFDALNLVQEVIKLGRISNYDRQYCYITVFGEYAVATDLNKKSDRFIISNNRK